MGAPGTQTCNVARGKTFFGSSQTIPSSSYYHLHENGGDVEGLVATFAHTDPSDPSKVLSQRVVTAVLMRNVSGVTVYKGLAVTAEAAYEGRRFSFYSSTTAQEITGVIDDHLGSGGCRNGDLCWVIIDGPFYGYTSYTTGGFVGNTITAGDPLYALTCATSNATTCDAGRPANWAGLTSTSQETTDGTQTKKTINRYARAISAATSGETNTLKLMDVCVHR